MPLGMGLAQAQPYRDVHCQNFQAVIENLTAFRYIQAMACTSHHHLITVDSAHIDFMGHVNNAFYLSWVQDAVLGHWHSIASAPEAAAHLWIALKHEISYRRPAFVGENITVTAVLDRIHGTRAFYSTLVKRGEEVLAEVSSVWCCLSSESRKPVRIAQDIAQRFFG